MPSHSSTTFEVLLSKALNSDSPRGAATTVQLFTGQLLGVRMCVTCPSPVTTPQAVAVNENVLARP